jgi:hypothetical protein
MKLLNFQYCPTAHICVTLQKFLIMTKRTVTLLFLLSLLPALTNAQLTRTIRGIVQDNASGVALEYATVSITSLSPPVGATSDSSGQFSISNVPVGRHEIQVSFIGYEPVILKDILVTSSKEVFLEIQMKENATQLGEIVVKPKIKKSEPLNTMTIASGRMLSVEEASRYAGGFDDPARLASSFAGVSSSIGNNGIVVRGNSPKFLQWRMEDVEIPNPNHFAEVTTFGGGGLTALSSQVLGNSDFFTGAFPAEYSNALSGVFDIHLRKGNNQKRENTVQVGLIGIDAASEGPFKKGGKSSYIFNYRYSTLDLLSSLMPENADGTKYQDLSFKLNFPTQKAGVFSVWGIGLIDRSGQTAKSSKTAWEYMQDRESQDVKQYMGAVGGEHKIYVGENAFFKTTLAATVSGLDLHTERMSDDLQLFPQNVINNTNWNFSLSSSFNKKFSSKHTNKTGLRFTGLKYDMLLKEANKGGQNMQTITDESGFSSLLAAYTNSSFSLSNNWVLNLGLTSQFFTLNNHYTIEPRAGLKWQFASNQSLGLAYGLHSRLEMLNYYFTKSAAGEQINQDLDFTRAHHFVLSYNRNIGENYNLKVEPYIQQLYNVPVIADSSFSFINLQGDWFIKDKLENKGTGLNYGVDLTFEKYVSQGYYYLFTASLFHAKYKGGDKAWHNSRYNRNYAFNLLTGKEWMTGKNKQNIISANVRFTYQGGDRYSPINESQSIVEQEAVYDESRAFSKQLPAAFIAHTSFSYKINRRQKAHEFAIKIINLTGYKDFYGHRYNFFTHEVDANRESIIIPNISYKIEF